MPSPLYFAASICHQLRVLTGVIEYIVILLKSYPDHLIVPKGYEADLLTISAASCMTYGYNEAMQASDAKYKIYMHQYVYILNRNILGDHWAIFASDPQWGWWDMKKWLPMKLCGLPSKTQHSTSLSE